MIFTFWEGRMPAYIQMCMRTWKFEHIVLNYGTLHEFTDIPIQKIKNYTLPQIADIVRVHVLRDNGGYWLDADTIMLSDELPKENILGYQDRSHTIGFLHTDTNSDMYVKWAEYQDKKINSVPQDKAKSWDAFGNSFTDSYVLQHMDIAIGDLTNRWPETYMIANKDIKHSAKYNELYFNTRYGLSDLRNTDMLMLHNSWTPLLYKALSERQVLATNCTLSNILKEVL